MEILNKLPLFELKRMLETAKVRFAEANRNAKLAASVRDLDPRWLNDKLDAQRWIDELEKAINERKQK